MPGPSRNEWMETTIRDIKYALRGFRRNPLFVLNVVGVIALGLGLNSALFTLFNTFVLRPLSVPDPYSLYQVNWSSRSAYGRASHGATMNGCVTPIRHSPKPSP